MKRLLLTFLALWTGLALSGKTYRAIRFDTLSAGDDPLTAEKTVRHARVSGVIEI